MQINGLTTSCPGMKVHAVWGFTGYQGQYITLFFLKINKQLAVTCYFIEDSVHASITSFEFNLRIIPPSARRGLVVMLNSMYCVILDLHSVMSRDISKSVVLSITCGTIVLGEHNLHQYAVCIQNIRGEGNRVSS